MIKQELIDADVPYLVDPADLRALGIDPRLHLCVRRPWFGYLLDRRKDSELIKRLETPDNRDRRARGPY
jgi:hypothetical protein